MYARSYTFIHIKFLSKSCLDNISGYIITLFWCNSQLVIYIVFTSRLTSVSGVSNPPLILGPDEERGRHANREVRASRVPSMRRHNRRETEPTRHSFGRDKCPFGNGALRTLGWRVVSSTFAVYDRKAGRHANPGFGHNPNRSLGAWCLEHHPRSLSLNPFVSTAMGPRVPLTTSPGPQVTRSCRVHNEVVTTSLRLGGRGAVWGSVSDSPSHPRVVLRVSVVDAFDHVHPAHPVPEATGPAQLSEPTLAPRTSREEKRRIKDSDQEDRQHPKTLVGSWVVKQNNSTY